MSVFGLLQDKIISGICCRVCGSLFNVKAGLCAVCDKAVFTGDCLTRRCERSDVPHYYLWRWSQSNFQSIGKIIEMQKEGRWKSLSQRAAQTWSSHLNVTQGKLQWKNTIVVPAPGVKRNDHAFALASALSEWTGLPLEDGLMRVNPERQKSKARTDRWRLRFESKVNFTTTNKHFILVDDVVTTGATVLAAKEALAGGTLCAVYSLCWREKLRQDV